MKQTGMKNIPDETPVLPSPEHTPDLPPAPPNSFESPPTAPYSYESQRQYALNSPNSFPAVPNNSEDSQYSPPYAPLSPADNQGLDQPQTSVPVDKETILQVDEQKPEENVNGDGNGENSEASNNSNDSKKIILTGDVKEDESKK
jgi:hypothetical protein